MCHAGFNIHSVSLCCKILRGKLSNSQMCLYLEIFVKSKIFLKVSDLFCNFAESNRNDRRRDDKNPRLEIFPQ